MRARGFWAKGLWLTGFSSLLLLLPGLSPALAQRGAELRSWGTHHFALEAGSTSSISVTIFASDTDGANGLQGVVRDMTRVDERATIRQFPGSPIWVQSATLQPGRNYSTTIDYRPGGLAFIHFRVFASQGNMFNRGRVILTDASDYRRENARTLYGEVSAWGGMPVWQVLLGLALWVSGYGTLLGAALLGTTQNSNTFTYAVPTDTGTTLHFKMTGCTAWSDYNGSFTIPAGLTPGAVYGVDVHGWCGGGGFGNWARVNQKVALPREFHPQNLRDSRVYDPRVPGYGIRFGHWTPSFRGPDDCGGTYTDSYQPNDGINYKIRGADCWPSSFGAPGELGGVRTSLPSLEVVFGDSQVRLDGFFSLHGETVFYSWLESRLPEYVPVRGGSFTFTPRATYSGFVTSSTQTGTGSAGGQTVSGEGIVYHFHFSNTSSWGTTNLIDLGQSVAGSMPQFSYTFPAYRGTCTLSNRSSRTVTVYELSPPQTFSVRPGEERAVSFPAHTLAPNSTTTLGRGGLYYVSSGNVGDIQSTNCTVVTSRTSDNWSVTLRPGFFVLQ